MAATVVIPARIGSTRFPGKMLADETGRPMVQHVVDRVRLCQNVRDVIVATDDDRLVEALSAFGTRCILTSAAHSSGTDRVAEVAGGLDDDVVVNVQGDEPEIEPDLIDRVVRRLQEHDDDMVTAATAFPAGADPADPNLVKVVVGVDGRAVYFSRSPIPFYRSDSETPSTGPLYRLHVGIYGYRRAFLLQLTQWSSTPLERAERLEQLRAIEHGRQIHVLAAETASNGIDTPEQYAAFVGRWHARRAPDLAPDRSG